LKAPLGLDISAEILPVSLVIPTRNRPAILRRTLESVAGQSAQPAEIIIIDASDDADANGSGIAVPGLQGSLIWVRAETVGAASQRNEGLPACHYSVIAFCDDDILCEDDCILRLWAALQSDARLGGVNAMIVNQQYHPPGAVSRLMFRLMAGCSLPSYAGRVLGPAINMLPEDRADLPAVVPVEWLNTTCTIYRREALPSPPFPDHFRGYSLAEDLALSLVVSKSWKLANARTARIYHDSQPGSHKADVVALAEMELFNRHYVMTEVMGRSRVADYARLALWEFFQLAVLLVQVRAGAYFWRRLRGKLRGTCAIIRSVGRSHPLANGADVSSP